MEINQSIRAKHLGRRLVLGGVPFIAGIVLHDTAGSGTHNDTKYLANPGDGRVVSVDYTVERDGSVYELNPDVKNNCTWHAGRATKFVVPGRILRNREVTQSTIGIELCHKSNPALDNPIWTDEQVKAVAELCLFLCQRYGLGKDRITTHAAVITDGTRSDPRAFPWSTFWFYFNKSAGTPAVNPSAPDLAVPVYYEVKAGDSLWKIAKANQTTIEAIKAANNLTSDVIQPGQRLIVRR
jgi:hypothetical protein